MMVSVILEEYTRRRIGLSKEPLICFSGGTHAKVRLLQITKVGKEILGLDGAAWEMRRRDLGVRPDLLPESEDDGQDIETENFRNASTRVVRRCHLGAGSKMVVLSPSSDSSQQRKRRRKHITLLKKALSDTWDHYLVYATIQDDDGQGYFTKQKKMKGWAGWHSSIGDANTEFKKESDETKRSRTQRQFGNDSGRH